MYRTLLEVHICLIQQNYGIPVAGVLEETQEAFLQCIGFMTKVGCSYAE
jgi:hypothetical protein